VKHFSPGKWRLFTVAEFARIQRLEAKCLNSCEFSYGRNNQMKDSI